MVSPRVKRKKVAFVEKAISHVPMITIGLAVLLAIASLMAACSMPHDNNNWDMNMTSTTRMATTKTLLRPRPLPDMSEGGMIFFLHVPKTGGTTLKSNFDETTSPNGFRVRARNNNVKESKFSRRIKYISGNWRSNLDSKFDYIKEFLTCHATERRKKYDKPVLFVEVHGMDSYNAIELQEFIKEWRSLAKIGGVPFFAFTMLREALSAQVSFFNFYHLVFPDCRFEQVPAHMSTREIEKQLLVPWSYNNPQCLFLARGERTFGERPASCYGMHSSKGLERSLAMKRGIQAERTQINQAVQQHSKPQMEALRNN